MFPKHIQLILALCCAFILFANCEITEAKKEVQTQTFSADKEYRVSLGRKEEKIINFDLEGMKVQIKIDITASGPFSLCNLSQNGQCQYHSYSKRETALTLKLEDAKWGIKVNNPSVQAKVKLRIIFHNGEPSCHRLQMQELHQKELAHTNCFEFKLDKEEDLSFLVGKQKFMDMEFQFNLCEANLLFDDPKNQDQFFFSAAKIHELCSGKSEKILNVIVIDREYSGEKTTEEEKGCNAEVMFILQSVSGSILLPEGIAYRTQNGLKDGNSLRFEYELINKMNTSITVMTEAKIEIYAKVVDEKNKDSTIPSKQNHDFSSKSGQIFTYFKPFLIITNSQLQKTICEDCWLLIAVDIKGEGKSLSIEITQQLSVMTNGEMKHHFLEGGSMAYYSYTPKIDTTVFYQMSDNNQGCAQFYLSDTMLPSSLNSLERSYHGKIMFKSSANKVYYIGVQAISDCPYSITVTDSSNELVLLEKGRFGYLNLGKDEIKYFLIRAESSKYIKLLSLHVYGKVEIYLNRTDSKGIQNFDSTYTKPTSFAMKGQFMNRLVLEHQQELFCDGCYYIVAVVALKVTESTLFYGDEDTPIPISDKIVNDIILREGETVTGQYYGVQKFDLQVKIHSGKLKVTIKNEKNTFQKEYSDKEIITTDQVSLGKKQGFFAFIQSLFDANPISVKFQAKEDNTVYSVRFMESEIPPEVEEEDKQENENEDKETEEKGKEKEKEKEKQKTISKDEENSQEQKQTKVHQKNLNVQAGVSEEFGISINDEVCLSGFFTDKEQKILLSCELEQKENLFNLNISLTSKEKAVKYETDILRNIMTITIPALSQYQIIMGLPYTICITSTSELPFDLSFMQTQDFALLPPQVDTVIRQQYTFVSHSQTPLIVDIFECRGRSSIIYGKERQQLQRNGSHSLDVIGLKDQSHAVRVNQLGTTFYKILAPLAIVRWFPFLIEEGIGTGYLDFAIGKISYKSGVFGISLNWESLSQERETNSTIEKVIFTVYISANTQDLKAASHCQSFLEDDTWQRLVDVNIQQSRQLGKVFSYTLSKGELVDSFGSNTTLFCTVVADVTIRPWQGEENLELYRFIYSEVQIPGQIVNKGYLNSMTMPQLIILGVALLLCLVLIFYCILRNILPLLGILKNRYLVEEEGGPQAGDNKVTSQAQPDDLIIPPSSERGAYKFDAMIQQLQVEGENK